MNDVPPEQASKVVQDLIAVLVKELPPFLEQSTREPATFLRNVRARLTELEQSSQRDLGGELLSFVLGSSIPKGESGLSRRAKGSPKDEPSAVELTNLIAAAEVKYRNAFLEELTEYWQSFNFAHLVEALEPIEEAKKAKGEIRARAVVRAMGCCAELLYQPYLTVIWHLTCHARGKVISSPKKLGVLVKSLSDQFPHGSKLIDPDAGWLRNASAHGHWLYDPDADELEVWDDTRPKQRLKVETLLARIEKWCTVSTNTLQAVMHSYLTKNWSSLRPVIHDLHKDRNQKGKNSRDA